MGRAAKTKPPESLLSPDERIRFMAEANEVYHHQSSLEWQDEAGRRWFIRPGVADNRQFVLFQCSKGETFREVKVEPRTYTAEKAASAIAYLDAEVR